jgi:single-strand DNA-binding protein
MNKVTIIGNLAADPKMINTDNSQLAKYRVITSIKWKDDNGNSQEKTEGINIVTFGKAAENIKNHIKKGSKVLVEGKIQTKKRKDKNGNTLYSTEVISNGPVKFLPQSSASLNRVSLLGNLGKDPKTNYLDTNKIISNFSIATTEHWSNSNGEKQETTEWHKIIVFDKKAELCDQYLEKGDLVYLEGRLQTRKWKDSNNVARYTTEVVVDNIKFMSSTKNNGTPNDYPENDVPF